MRRAVVFSEAGRGCVVCEATELCGPGGRRGHDGGTGLHIPAALNAARTSHAGQRAARPVFPKRAWCKRNLVQSSARTTKIGAQFSAQTHKIGHSLERERPSLAHFYSRTSKVRAQSSTRTKQDLGTVLWAIDKNMGTNLQALYISCLKTQKQKLQYSMCRKKKIQCGQGAM